jgi:serine/threonine-protein kinase HipA
MNRKGTVLMYNFPVGEVGENNNGYYFKYNEMYLKSENAIAISLTLPLSKEGYISNNLFPFFDGLIPEGWLLDIAERNWKLNSRDRMGLLLNCCKDCIGAVSVELIEEKNEMV